MYQIIKVSFSKLYYFNSNNENDIKEFILICDKWQFTVIIMWINMKLKEVIFSISKYIILYFIITVIISNDWLYSKFKSLL